MIRLGLVIVVCVLFLVGPAVGQTREEGPWWPHPLWGAEDQAGASNWITAEKVLAAVKLVETGGSTSWGRSTNAVCRCSAIGPTA